MEKMRSEIAGYLNVLCVCCICNVRHEVVNFCENRLARF